MATNSTLAAQFGSNAFGTRPAPIAPPNPFNDLAAVYPNLSGTNALTSAAIASQLAGQLSPSTLANIQDAAARFGVASGLPGSGLVRNRTVRDIGLTTEQQQQRGLQNYATVAPVISSTQTLNPALQIQVADRNSVYAAAPDPTAAASYAEQLYSKYLGMTRGGGVSPARGTVRLGGAPSLPGRATPSPASGFGYNPVPVWQGGNNAALLAETERARAAQAADIARRQSYLWGDAPAYYTSPGQVPYDFAGDPSSLVGTYRGVTDPDSLAWMDDFLSEYGYDWFYE
jgi:hypothetical protein